MYNRTEKTFLAKHKSFFLILLAFYIAGSYMGIVLFHSPNLSKEYLSKYSSEHNIYREITKNPNYFKYKQRPHLYQGTPTEIEQFKFALNYEEKPEFKAEKRRVFFYLFWFKSLNLIILLLVTLRLGWSPLMKYIDKYQRGILNKRNELEKISKQVSDELTKSEQIYNTLPEYKEKKEKEKKEILQAKLQEIERQKHLAKEQMEFLFETKKKEEVLNCVNNIKKILIEEAIKKVEQELIKTETPERLSQTIDRFNFLMRLLS